VTDRHGRCVVYRAARVAVHRNGLPPIVCVPGLTVSSRYMVPLMHALAPHARVYSPHPPGHAGSDQLRQVSVTAYARALIDWLDAMHLPRVALVANSMGCQVSLHVAAMAPERVAACVLIGPTADRRARTTVAQGTRLLRSIPFDQRSIDLVVLADYLSTSVKLGLKEVAAMLLDTPEHTARVVQCPVLYVRGAHDHVASRAWLRALAHATPTAWSCTVPQAGHAVHYTQAATVARLCRQFIARATSLAAAAGSAYETAAIETAGYADRSRPGAVRDSRPRGSTHPVTRR
jgi:2-hydroxy-6-oxonona-2,4-dienedioate hydrolase